MKEHRWSNLIGYCKWTNTIHWVTFYFLCILLFSFLFLLCLWLYIPYYFYCAHDLLEIFTRTISSIIQLEYSHSIYEFYYGLSTLIELMRLFPYIWMPWRCSCCCYDVNQQWTHGFDLGTRSTTSCTSTCLKLDYGEQLFFRYATCLVVTIYDSLLTWCHDEM